MVPSSLSLIKILLFLDFISQDGAHSINAQQGEHLPLCFLFKSKLNSSRKVFTECIEKHIALHYLLLDTNNYNTQNVFGHKLVMLENTIVFPVPQDLLGTAANM